MPPSSEQIASVRPAPPWFRWLSGVSFFLTATVLSIIAVAHLVYPGFTETMEGDILQHIERASRGLPIDPNPGAEFIALTYMPLYYFAAAPFYLVFGDSLFGPRLLSVVAAFGSAAWIWRIAHRETGSHVAGALAVAFFCAGFRVMDAALFTVHPDALLLFWLLSGFWSWAYGKSKRDDLIWLVCFTLAFLTKQHGALFFGWAVLYAFLFRVNALPRWAIGIGIVLGGPVAYAAIGGLLGERFFFHTLILPSHWEQSWWFSIRRASYVLTVFAPIAFVVTLKYWQQLRSLQGWKPTPLVWFIAGSLATALITMRISGASNNHYAPLHVALGIVLAIMCHRLATTSQSADIPLLLVAMAVLGAVSIITTRYFFPQHDAPVFVPVVVSAAAVVFLLLGWVPQTNRGRVQAATLILAQFAVSYFAPWRYLPPAGWQDGVHHFRQEIARLDAPVIWVSYGNIPADFTGRKIARSPSWVALEDIDRQQIDRGLIEADLKAWRDRIRNAPKLYLLSHEPLRGLPVWNSMAAEFELVRDYGDEFATVPQIADHWYGAEAPPRFLYRKKQEK